MKKNVMMRLAAILLVCVLATTCSISGTFAKYVTKAEATDTARVAKWGIVLTVSGDDIFSTEYESGNKTVISSDDARLVAPGTKNDTGITFTLSGTPEVAFKLTATLTANLDENDPDDTNPNISDVFLAAGTYKDYTTADPDDEFTLTEAYYPVVFTLKHTFETGAYSIAGAVENTGATCKTKGNVDTITGTLAQINQVLSNLTDAMQQKDPGYVLKDTFTLTWAWDFDDNGAGTNDKADTLLGNIAAGVENTLAEDAYNLWLKYSFSITVEQVD